MPRARPRGLSVIEAAPASEAAREIDALAMKSTAQEKGKRLEQEDDCTHDDSDRTAAAREEAGGSRRAYRRERPVCRQRAKPSRRRKRVEIRRMGAQQRARRGAVADPRPTFPRLGGRRKHDSAGR